WHALRHRQAASGMAFDVVRVGDPPGLPLGSPDPDVLIWAENQARILLSGGRRAMGQYLAGHLPAGRTSPGIFLTRRKATVSSVLQWLDLVVADDDLDAWRDRLIFVPDPSFSGPFVPRLLVMATVTARRKPTITQDRPETVADLLRRLGNVPAHR